MTESEQIARWLGFAFEPLRGYKIPGLWRDPSGMSHADLPNFRTSNEWAGAVLEKLKPDRGPGWSDANEKWMVIMAWADFDAEAFRGPTWRDTVVDAALEVIRRGDSATGDSNG